MSFTCDTESAKAHRPRWNRVRARGRSVLLLLLTLGVITLLAAGPARASTPPDTGASAAAETSSAPGTSSAVGTSSASPPASAHPTTSVPAPTTPPATTDAPAPSAHQSTASVPTPTTQSAGTPDSADPANGTTGSTATSTTPQAESNGAASDQAGTTWSVSDSVRQFLTGLDLQLSDGPLTGTVSGTTLTVAIDNPSLPLTLPGGVGVSVTGASLEVDEADGTLTLTGSVAGPGGIGGSLSVSIAHSAVTELNGAGGTDLSASVTVTGVPFLSSTVDLEGHLALVGGKVTASVTGTLAADLAIAPDLVTLTKGSSVTLSTADGLALSGTAAIGPQDTAVTVDISGTVSGPKDFSLTVDDTTNPPTFTPATGLTLTPAFTGTIKDTAGSVAFDLAADDAVTWKPTGDVTVAVKHVEISNDTPNPGLSCPPSFKDGDLWVAATGAVSDEASGVSATGGACIDLTAHAFTLSATESGTFGPTDLGFGLSDAGLSVTGDLKAGTVSASVGAKLTLTAVAGQPEIPVTLDLSSDGSFTAAASVDLSQLHLGSGSGTLLLSSKEIAKYTNNAVGVKSPIDLPAGITVLLTYQPDDQVKQVFDLLKVPVPHQIQAQASLSPSGFSIELDLDLGAGGDGVSLLPGTPGGFALHLNTLRLKVAVTEAGGSISIGGTAQLHVPALYQGSDASDIDLTVSGSLSVTDDGAVKIAVGFDLAAAHGTWTNALGIHGLSIRELAASIGVEVAPEQLDIPLPTISFTVNDVVLPDAWASAIGELPGTDVSATLDLDVDNPILSFAIAAGAGQPAALEPLRIANAFTTATHAAPLPDSVVSALQLQGASLLFAPLGGTDATGHAVSPGASLVFDATIAGSKVHVDGSIGIAPYPHLSAHVSVSHFSVGPVTFSGATPGSDPSLSIDIEANPTAPKADFDFSAGFADSVTGIKFAANIDLGASISALHASVTLQIAAGQPSYIAAGAQLTGSVYTGNSGLAFSASGYADAYVEGHYVGGIWFSFSTDTGSVFATLSELASQIAGWFRNVYAQADVAVAGVLSRAGVAANQIASSLKTVFGDIDTQVASALTQIGTSATTVATTLRDLFSDGDTAVASALNRAGVFISNTAYAVHAAFGDADVRVTAVLNQIGVGAAQIAQGLQIAFGDSQAAVYNAFQQIGQAGQGVLDAINGFFHSGSYWIYSNPWYSVPLFLDNSNGSYAAWNPIIQWTWNGGHNQDWYVLPTDSGYAEIVNRQTGQCLSQFGGAGAQVVQYPCYGYAQQQWNLGVYPGQNLNYTGHNVTNRYNGLNLDVNGGSTSAGAAIDTWYGNGNWNQWFTFEPAVG